jgi:hypothetical protein
LLVWQFNSLRRAAIIILTMPLIINHDPLSYGMASVMFFGLGIGSLGMLAK